MPTLRQRFEAAKSAAAPLDVERTLAQWSSRTGEPIAIIPAANGEWTINAGAYSATGPDFRTALGEVQNLMTAAGELDIPAQSDPAPE